MYKVTHLLACLGKGQRRSDKRQLKTLVYIPFEREAKVFLITTHAASGNNSRSWCGLKDTQLPWNNGTSLTTHLKGKEENTHAVLSIQLPAEGCDYVNLLKQMPPGLCLSKPQMSCYFTGQQDDPYSFRVQFRSGI